MKLTKLSNRMKFYHYRILLEIECHMYAPQVQSKTQTGTGIKGK